MVVIGGCAGLELKERELLFRPTREAAGWYSGMPESVQEIYLPVGASAPGERIHAWWWPAEDPRAPVVYYLHGVRWNLTGQLNRISQLRRFGFAVFAIDYRGFGKSDGEMPSEATVYEDARVGWKWLIAREPDPARRYIYGHSLGGAVAIDLAAELSGDPVGARGLIVESTFTSLPELVSEMGYGWLPRVAEIRFDRQDRTRQDARAVRARRGGSLRAAAFERSALCCGAAAEEIALDSQWHAQQQRVAGRCRLPHCAAGAVRADRGLDSGAAGAGRAIAPAERRRGRQPWTGAERSRS